MYINQYLYYSLLCSLMMSVTSCNPNLESPLCPNRPCNVSLLDQVNFYTVDDLNFERFEKGAIHHENYNKTYDPTQFLDSFYLSWRLTTISNSENQKRIKDEFFTYKNGIAKNSPCFTGNYQEYSDRYLKIIKENIPLITEEHFTSIDYGITTETVDLRSLPTSEFCFKSIRNAGEGYPFDYLQESTLWIGTPIALITESNDRKWSFVTSPYGMGWIQSERIAQVSDRQKEEIIQSKKIVITKDNLILNSKTDTYTLFAGSILPLDSKTNEILIPISKGSNSVLSFDRIRIDTNSIQEFPLEFNADNVKTMLASMLDGKYSWGGIGGGRDCSSTLKDYFAAFGIWMPRNSKQQRYCGSITDLGELDSKQIKANTIVEQGLPFLSTLYMPGHIVLYLGGNQNNTMQIYHSVWGLKPYFTNKKLSELAAAREQLGLFGVRLRDNHQVETRTIIGKTVITDIEPESNIQAMDDVWVIPFLEYMETMTLPIDRK